jgi:hypothetical protein
MVSGSYNHIKDTTISNNGFEKYSQFFGVEIFRGVNNVIESCQILNNCDGGIWIGWESWNNYIIKSTIAKNGHESDYHRKGVFCHSENYIYLNNFIKNRIQAKDVNGKSHWDNGKFGNYWSNYEGEDHDYDGIGDTPYNLSEDSNQDNYPLMLPYNGDGPSVEILTPEDGFLYLRNLKLFSFKTSLIFGNIKIKAIAACYNSDYNYVDKVEFYVDGRLRWIDRTAPFSWRWRLSSHIKHNHTISVVVYDSSGDTAVDELQVWRFF